MEALTVHLFVFATAPWWLLFSPSWGDKGELLGKESWSEVCSEKAPDPSEMFFRDSEVAKKKIPNRQHHEEVGKTDELLSIDCWKKPPQVLAGPKSTSLIRCSHHLKREGKKYTYF